MGQNSSTEKSQILKNIGISKLLNKKNILYKTDPTHPIFQQKIPNKGKSKNCTNSRTQELINDNSNNVKRQNLFPDIVQTSTNIKPKTRRPRSKVRSEILLYPHTIKKYKRNKIQQTINDIPQFGYDIPDIDIFLTKGTIEKPANIPVVLAFPTTLYKPMIEGYHYETFLPLGMVVNAVFKNENWLYIQTPHAEEGYVTYAACLPLGIIPPSDEVGPCWERNNDVFPKLRINTDVEKVKAYSDRDFYQKSTDNTSVCGEDSVDCLYMKLTALNLKNPKRHKILMVAEDFDGYQQNAMSVKKDDVVFLINSSVKDWLWVRNKNGEEGFIPVQVARNEFF